MRWTHPSVVALAGQGDPVQAIQDRSRAVVYKAMGEGWSGPPFDPMAVARLLRIPTEPNEDVVDARTVPAPGKRLRIEYNPGRPLGRMRFSVAHELGHSLFPDCHARVRHRMATSKLREDEWQLEMLCNIAAAEILMPVGSFPNLREESLDIDNLMRLREAYQVSAEALLLRAARLADRPCAVFCASSREATTTRARYHIDYAASSCIWGTTLACGMLLPQDSVVADCTAIGFTAKDDESWGKRVDQLHVECVGIPPYPGRRLPRVVGIVTPTADSVAPGRCITYVTGDATQPRGKGAKIVAHLVNDRGRTWGAGFGLAVRRQWPNVQRSFRRWTEENRKAFVLGATHYSEAEKGLTVFSMVAQRGYGPSLKPRVRYGVLADCLRQLRVFAQQKRASVHMPRIGSGEAGGSWPIVRELTEEALCRHEITVTVYNLPSSRRHGRSGQQDLFDLIDPATAATR